MSLIHKALQQSGNSSPTSSVSGFNPFSEKPLKQPKRYAFLILCVCLVIAIVTVLFWPKSEVATPLLATPAQQQINPEPIVTEPNNTLPSIPMQTSETAEITSQTLVEPTVKTTNKLSDQPTNDSINSTSLTTKTSELVQQDLTELVALSEPTPQAEKTPAPTPAQSITLASPEPKASSLNSSSSSAVSIASATSSNAQGDSQVDSVISSAAQVRPTPNEPQTTQSVIQTSQSIWASQVEESLALGQIEQAEVQLKQWIGAAPNDPIPRTWLARIYISNGAEKAAEPLLINQSTVDAQGLLGIVYERTARPDLAATIFESLYRTEPSQGQWLLFWAVNSERSGQFAKSQQLYQTYLNLFSFDDPSLDDFAKRRLIAIGGPQ